MKKIIAILIAAFMLLSVCSCKEQNPKDTEAAKTSAVTEAAKTEADTAPHTESGTEASATDAPSTEPKETDAPSTDAPSTEAPVTEAPVTEAPVTEAPATTEAPDTTPVENERVYRLFTPETYGDENNESYIYLYDDNSYVMEAVSRIDQVGISYCIYGTEGGTYEVKGALTECTAVSGNFKIRFDNDESKNLLLGSLQTAVQAGQLAQEQYDLIIAMCSENGYDIDDMSNLPEFIAEDGSLEYSSRSVIVIADDGAYDISKGLGCGDGQYAVPELDFMLELGNGGKCVFRYETEVPADESMPAYTYVSVYEGTYSENDGFVCIMKTSYDYMKFKTEADKAAFEKELQDEYDAGYIAKVYYEYYKAAISEEGYKEEYEETDKYVFKRFGPEPSHVCYVVETPDFDA